MVANSARARSDFGQEQMQGQGARSLVSFIEQQAELAQPSEKLRVFSDNNSGLEKDRVVDTIVFADGSRYSGTLRNGVPDGLGTCVWTDGNQYDGEWRGGVMHGFGTYLWTSGQRYDGEWRDGKREGVGVKRYADGSTFDGFWRDGRKHGIGVFRPARKDGGDKKKERGQLTRAQGSARGANAFVGVDPVQGADSMQVVEPSEASVGSAAAASAERRIVYIRAFDNGRLVREDRLNKEEIKTIFGSIWGEARKKNVRQKFKAALGIGKRLQQKQGQLLYKGMPGYELMIKLQLGVRYSVGKASHPSTTQRDADGHLVQPPPPDKLDAGAFKEKGKIFFPTSGSPTTPAHPSSDFKWKDYCPRVFRSLRGLFGINDAEYMLSLGGSQALWQLNSPGKSGCMFFLSDDEKFLIKTMRKSEIEVLLNMMPLYHAHMSSCRSSLVTRFFGVHGVKQVHGRTVRFVVMANLFNTDLQIHRKFDLKGSTEGRTAGQVDANDPKTVLKDLDLDIKLRLDKATHEKLLSTLALDADFLRKAGVMDYSLLLGIHCPHRRNRGEDGAEQPNATSAGGAHPHPHGSSPHPGPHTQRGRSSAPGTGTSPSANFKDRPGSGQIPLPALTAPDDASITATGAGVTGGRYTSLPSHTTDSTPGVGGSSTPASSMSPGQSVATVASAALAQAQGQSGNHGAKVGSSSMAVAAGDVTSGATAAGGRPPETLSSDGGGTGGGSVPNGSGAFANVFAARTAAGIAFGDPTPLPPAGSGGASQMSGQTMSGLVQQDSTVDWYPDDNARHTPPHNAAPSIRNALFSTSPAGNGLSNGFGNGFSHSSSGLAVAAEQLPNNGPLAGNGQLVMEGSNGQAATSEQAVAAATSGGRGNAHANMLQGTGSMLSMTGTGEPLAGTSRSLRDDELQFEPSLQDRARNFDLFSDKLETERQLRVFEASMREMRYPEQRMADILGLARLKILGAKMKKRGRESRSGGGGQQSVLKAVQSMRLNRDWLDLKLDEHDDALGGSEDELESPRGHEPSTLGSGVPSLGFQVPAIAVSKANGMTEEVVLCFGIIDILQDFNFRKHLERGFKSIIHDGFAISVAPPKLYARRFLDFLTSELLGPPMPSPLLLTLPPAYTGGTSLSMTPQQLTPTGLKNAGHSWQYGSSRPGSISGGVSASATSFIPHTGVNAGMIVSPYAPGTGHGSQVPIQTHGHSHAHNNGNAGTGSAERLPRKSGGSVGVGPGNLLPAGSMQPTVIEEEPDREAKVSKYGDSRAVSRNDGGVMTFKATAQ